MSKVFFDCAISLDGFLAGDDRGPENPLGTGGPDLHTWMIPLKGFRQMHGTEGGEEGPENDILEKTIARTGAYIMGKRMFEEGEAHWPEDLFKADVYVLTHEKREPWVQQGSTTYYFADDGIESALERAKKSAGEKDVRLQGGADMIQQFLNAGLVDDFIVHLSPVILGSGIRLFDNLDKNKFQLDVSEAIDSKLATHLRYIVINK